MQPQYLWVTDDEGALIVDQVYKLEQLDVVYPALMNRLGLAVSNDEPLFGTLNKSKKSEGDIEIIENDAEVKEIILNRYQKDFQLFNYPE